MNRFNDGHLDILKHFYNDVKIEISFDGDMIYVYYSFDDIFKSKNYDKIKELRLKDYNEFILPEQLKNIEILRLNYCNNIIVPNSFTKLKKIYVSECYYIKVPMDLMKSNNIKFIEF